MARLAPLVIAVILAAPLAAATYNDEVGAQLTWTTNGGACGTAQNTGTVLTTGQRYIAVMAAHHTTPSTASVGLSDTSGVSLFRVSFAGTLSSVAVGTNPTILSHETLSHAPTLAIRSVVEFTATTTAVQPFCSDRVVTTPVYPAGVQYAEDMLGFVANLTYTGGLVGMLYNANLTQPAESVVVAGETDKAPDSNLHWIRLNPEVVVATGTSSGSSIRQAPPTNLAYTYSATQGVYLGTSALNMRQTATCGGTVWISVHDTLPFNVANEVANVTFTATSFATNVDVTVNWQLETVTAVGGGSVTGVTFTASPLHGPGTWYHRISTSNNACLGVNARNLGSPTAWTNDAGTTNNALPTTSYKHSYYSANTTTYRHSLTPQNVGGAAYTLVREDEIDTFQSGIEFNGPDGASISPAYQAIGSAGSAVCPGALACTVREYRLHYLEEPHETSFNIDLDVELVEVGRNIVYAARYLPSTQPVHPRVTQYQYTALSSPLFADMPAYSVWGTDQYSRTLTVTVKECLETSTTGGCTSIGGIVPNVSYTGDIGSALSARPIVGSTSTGVFAVTGQDLQSSVVTLTLLSEGYQTTTYSVNMGSDDKSVTLLLPAASTEETLSAPVTITFGGNNTRVVPDRVNITVQRSVAVPLYVDCALYDAASGTFRGNACRVDDWTAGEPNLYDTPTNFLYPPSRNQSETRDVGTYLLFVVDASGNIIGKQPFCILSTWTGTGCSVPVSSSGLSDLAGSTLDEIASLNMERSLSQAAATEATVREHFLNALDFAFRAFATDCDQPDQWACRVPNIAWWYLGTLIIAGMGVANGWRRSE